MKTTINNNSMNNSEIMSELINMGKALVENNRQFLIGENDLLEKMAIRAYRVQSCSIVIRERFEVTVKTRILEALEKKGFEMKRNGEAPNASDRLLVLAMIAWRHKSNSYSALQRAKRVMDFDARAIARYCAA